LPPVCWVLTTRLKAKPFLPVVAGAGAYYAYKKSKDAEKSANRYPDTNDRYTRNGDVYPDTGYDSFAARSRRSARVSVD
jgi:hypothetical protein